MNYFLDKNTQKHKPKLCLQLETIQDDLLRLSALVNQISELSENELTRCDILDQLEEIHLWVSRFEASCRMIQAAGYEDDFTDDINEESFETNLQENKNWTIVRREAKRAHKLADQLTSSLIKIRAGLGEHQHQNAVPEDLIQINRVVGNVVNGLASDWVNNQE